MKYSIRQFLFGTSLTDNRVLNTGWLLFRLHIGLSMAIHAGWPKMNNLTAPAWFNEQVAGLGFTFPSPAFWAILASWGEFVGGICIALGLLTRFSALQLAFQFFVISFLWYEEPEPVTGMYFQQTLFWGYVLAVFAGGGRYSLDKMIMSRRKIRLGQPVKTSLAALLLLVALGSSAQKGPLNGSGRIVSRNVDYTNFEKISLTDLPGKTAIVVGRSYSVNIEIDDNLASLLAVSAENGKLEIALTGNENNKLYLENTNITIRVSLPVLTELEHRGNGEVQVSGISGSFFRLEKSGNGNILLNGTIDELEIRKNGNGDVNAIKLQARSADIHSSGNGDVIVNANQVFRANGTGNGDIKNTGPAPAAEGSSRSGNGAIIDANYKPHGNPYSVPEQGEKVKSRIRNTTREWAELKVVYPVKGSYGISIRPGQTHREYFPLGTKIYKDDKTGELLFEITAANRGAVLQVE